MSTTVENGLHREQVRLVKRVSRRAKRQSASLDAATAQLLRERLWLEAAADPASDLTSNLLKLVFRIRALDRQEGKDQDEWTDQEKMDAVTKMYGCFPDVIPCLPQQVQDSNVAKQ